MGLDCLGSVKAIHVFAKLSLLYGLDGGAELLFAGAEVAALHVVHAEIFVQDGQACAP